MKQFDDELISGSIYRSVWKLAWPVVLAQLISGIHGFINQVMVAHYVDDHAANAAIGISWQLFLVMVVFIVSLFQGMSVLVARYSGKRDHDALNRIFYDVFIASFWILICVAAPLGFFLTPHLLDLAAPSPEVRAYAEPYLRILFTCSAPLFMMYMLINAFQSTGDTRTPLMLGVLTSLCNVIFSYFFITGFGPFPELGTIGAAMGTVLGPIPSVCIAIWLILSHRHIVGRPKKFTLLPDMSVIWSVARLGIPTGIQAFLLNVAGAILLGFVGKLEHSTDAQAAYVVCYSQLFSFVTWASFGLRASSATIMGQNLGAGNDKRAKHGVYVTTLMSVIWSAMWAAIYLTLQDPLLALFNIADGEALDIGRQLLNFLAVSAFFVSAALAFTGGLQGAGDTISPMIIAFVSQIVVLLGICFALQFAGMLTPTGIWTAILFSHITRFVATVVMFQRGDWANIKVELKPQSVAGEV